MFKLSDNEVSYMLVLFPEDFARNSSHLRGSNRPLMNANIAYKIISYRPFEWTIIKHRYIYGANNITFHHISNLVESLINDYENYYDCDLTIDYINAKFVKHFMDVGNITLANQFSQIADEDYLRFINKEINQSQYYFPK